LAFIVRKTLYDFNIDEICTFEFWLETDNRWTFDCKIHMPFGEYLERSFRVRL